MLFFYTLFLFPWCAARLPIDVQRASSTAFKDLDPRSGDINTEIGLYVESPALARQVIAYMDEGVLPYNSYRVELDKAGELVWRTRKDGEPVQYTKDPESTFWQRCKAGFIRLLPIEDQL